MTLVRGADLTLVMPRNPNVYHDANRKALAGLAARYSAVGRAAAGGAAGSAAGAAAGGAAGGAAEGAGGAREGTAGGELACGVRGCGELSAYLIDDMLHAKVQWCRLTPASPCLVCALEATILKHDGLLPKIASKFNSRRYTKVFMASNSASGEIAVMMGSCNLKRRSFYQFVELNALITQAGCTRGMADELQQLVAESRAVTAEARCPYTRLPLA